MQRIEYRDVVDKAGWKTGPWQNEPDKVQWQDEATGLPCLIVRGPIGAWCGYVGVSKGHPYYGLGYDDDKIEVGVHGGLTFANACAPEGNPASSICHIVEPGEDDHVHWLGFDCAHCGDRTDIMHHYRTAIRDEVYRDVAYVTAEVESLAKQLKEAAS